MSDLKVEGPELKKMVKLGRKQSLSFGFSPGTGNDHALLIHRRKNPSMLGKLARKESGGKKVAFGTFEVKGRTVEMTCERLIPQLAKTVKKYMKSQKASVNVVILDMDGNAVESDIEDLAPDPDMEDGAAEADFAEAEDAAADAPEPEAEAEDAEQQEEAPAQDAAALAARLKALQPAIAAAEEAAATKLKAVMAAAVGQIKSSAFDKAETTISALEAAVAKLTAASGAAPEAAAEPADSGPDFKALAVRAQALKGAIADAAEPARDKLMTALGAAAKTIKDRNYDAADSLLSRIEAALEKVSAAPQTADAAEQAEPAEAVVETSRQNWIQTRSTLHKDIADLKAEIDKATAGVEGLEDVAAKSDVLFNYIKGIDENLENALSDLSKAAEDTSRDALKAKALQIVDTYKGVLDTDFFKAVDDNGFKKTNIRGAALASLQQVSAALAA